jgi:hypothetical protein
MDLDVVSFRIMIFRGKRKGLQLAYTGMPMPEIHAAAALHFVEIGRKSPGSGYA